MSVLVRPVTDLSSAIAAVTEPGPPEGLAQAARARGVTRGSCSRRPSPHSSPVRPSDPT